MSQLTGGIHDGALGDRSPSRDSAKSGAGAGRGDEEFSVSTFARDESDAARVMHDAFKAAKGFDGDVVDTKRWSRDTEARVKVRDRSRRARPRADRPSPFGSRATILHFRSAQNSFTLSIAPSMDRSARSPPPPHPARDVYPSGHRIERARGGRARGRRPRPRRHPPLRQARSVPPRPRGRGVDAQVRSITFTPVHARPRPSAGALSVALSRPMKRPCHQIPNQSHHLPPRRPPIERPAATRRRPTRARFSTR